MMPRIAGETVLQRHRKSVPSVGPEHCLSGRTNHRDPISGIPVERATVMAARTGNPVPLTRTVANARRRRWLEDLHPSGIHPAGVPVLNALRRSIVMQRKHF
jgi:hypothetical protein